MAVYAEKTSVNFIKITLDHNLSYFGVKKVTLKIPRFSNSSFKKIHVFIVLLQLLKNSFTIFNNYRGTSQAGCRKEKYILFKLNVESPLQ
jgi:hypothetical protein